MWFCDQLSILYKLINVLCNVNVKKNGILHKNLVNKKGPTWSKSMFQFLFILPKSQNWPKYGQKTDLIVILCAYGRRYIKYDVCWVIFQGSHSTQKLRKQKSSQRIQVNVTNFYYFAEIPKMTEIWPINWFFWQK